MLNFRKLRRDFSPSIISMGRELHDKEMVLSAKIIFLDSETIKICGEVLGSYDNTYECFLEISRLESEVIDSSCGCPLDHDCQHIPGLLFFLEDHLDKLIVEYSNEADLDDLDDIDTSEKALLLETFEKSKSKHRFREDANYQRELLREYNDAARVFRRSPFFLPQESLIEDNAELILIFDPPSSRLSSGGHNIQVMLRFPWRSKLMLIPDIKEFLESIRYHEPFTINGRRFFFTHRSFDTASTEVISMLLDQVHYYADDDDSDRRTAMLNHDAFGALLAAVYSLGSDSSLGSDVHTMPCLYRGSIETPLTFSPRPAKLRFMLELFKTPSLKLLLKPLIVVDDDEVIAPDDANLFECTKPGMIYNNIYYRFRDSIKRMHLQSLPTISTMTIPEPLFGTFVENSLPELQSCAEVSNIDVLKNFVTIPYVDNVEARCDINYLNGELEATLFFLYGDHEVPAAYDKLSYEDITAFVSDDGVVARNITEERSLLHDLFQDFIFDAKEGIFIAKSKKKIVEFMTDIVPKNQHRVEFHCPENLLEQFIYDDTTFSLSLKDAKNITTYDVDLTIKGALSGISMNILLGCLSSNKPYIELTRRKKKSSSDEDGGFSLPKILVLDLEALRPIIEVLDEVGITTLDSHTSERPLWSLVALDFKEIKKLPIKFSVSAKLKELQKQILGKKTLTASTIPEDLTATFRNYQVSGVSWLERLRNMHLNGILADDMGLGKTLQAIAAVAQHKRDNSGSISLVICPTSLLYNWLEEVNKFHPSMKVLIIDGIPEHRKKLLSSIKDYDLIITSYGLIQKDIDIYKEVNFSYIILDEGQHIKNHNTLNARSVKELSSSHKLILTGTPIENSLDELWSLFDFLMPGLLSNYRRFNDRYLSHSGSAHSDALKALNAKVSPFILRRMKKDVLSDLPPVSEILYHCKLTATQQELYSSYVSSAREELTKLVDKEGYNKVQIHVLATLTRLKQICCHPAIFAKDKVESEDSAKYEMLLELLQTLRQGGHKTVIFSQYTRMLAIIREDLTRMGVKFSYLDGTSKNRLDIVKKFNGDATIPIFLVSLRAGGSGLNITGADTVIHYDMWWNPAVEQQATDRVHRIGQNNNVSAYKLVTLGTVEEKIVELQNRKKALVEKVITDDDDIITKLSWDEVLELLQT
ncbi:MAG: DEAD/DEAH box helicase family protein [Waddliaceae bacterium]|jgi:SNF2 family DNA or RNA helicase|nr:DEAD/DEAH box helicase family protein [Waddliaceae bacterium]MBT3578869.1 DEAD/DEAH box helicase family protein [Waddliaceae bacterium]MBT4445055.1 DEAD/DEAH box helicase family protein [Waddliaceae bacterium]MBT7264062.1 DEAD/DEAH box helicase family protein [Waddliaceae bacterium]